MDDEGSCELKHVVQYIVRLKCCVGRHVSVAYEIYKYKGMYQEKLLQKLRAKCTSDHHVGAGLPQQHDSNPAGPRNISALSLHAGMIFPSFELMIKIRCFMWCTAEVLNFFPALFHSNI